MNDAIVSVAIGCAGWSLRNEHFDLFPGEDPHLTRYARRLAAVELNSSFYRPHRRSTYERWAASVPETFRFAVKAPREITHERCFMNSVVPLEMFLDQVAGLGDRLGPILLQLPPAMEYSRRLTRKFLTELRSRFEGAVAVEPRHASWFEDEPGQCLSSFRIARVAADPCVVAAAAVPGGWPGLVYYRLHGSPQMYESPYGAERLRALATSLSSSARNAPTWCVFDNTKFGAAVTDALDLVEAHLPHAVREPGTGTAYVDDRTVAAS